MTIQNTLPGGINTSIPGSSYAAEQSANLLKLDPYRIAAGTLAGRPATGAGNPTVNSAGNTNNYFYYATDTQTLYYDTSAGWTEIVASVDVATLATAIHAATSKTTPVSADELPITDSAASYGLKKLTYGNLLAVLTAAFNALYVSVTGAVTSVFGRTGAVTLLSADVNGVGAITNNTSGTAAGLSSVLAPGSGGTGVANAKNLTISNALTLAGTDATTMTFPSTSQTVAGLGVNQSWTKAQTGTPSALTVSANAVAVDLSLGNNFSLTLQATTAQTLSNPTNIAAGTSGQMAITQNATPSTLAYGSYWIEATSGTAPAVSATASAQNLLSYYVFDATHIYFVLNKHGVA